MDDAFVPEADELDYVPQVYQGFCPQCGVALQVFFLFPQLLFLPFSFIFKIFFLQKKSIL